MNMLALKGYSTFLEIGSFYHSPRVKQLSFTVFESIQTFSGLIDFHSSKKKIKKILW